MKHYCKLEICGRIGRVSITKNGRSIYLCAFTICVEETFTTSDGQVHTGSSWFHAKTFLRKPDERLKDGADIWVIGMLKRVQVDKDGTTEAVILVQSFGFSETDATTPISPKEINATQNFLAE